MRSKFSAFVFVLAVLAFAMPALAGNHRHPRPGQYRSSGYYGNGYQGSELQLAMDNNASIVSGILYGANYNNGYQWDNGDYGYRYDSRNRRYRHNGSVSSWLNLAATTVVGGIEIHKQNQTNERLDRLSRNLEDRTERNERPVSQHERPVSEDRVASVTVVNHTHQTVRIFGTEVPADGGLEVQESADALDVVIQDDTCKVRAKHTSGVIELTCW